jgi:lipoprotein-releasing system permease protein
VGIDVPTPFPSPSAATDPPTLSFPFSLFLALRYLKPKRSFVSVISVISVLGVTIGVSAMIVVLSVMTGFGVELRRKVLGFEAHLTVSTQFGTIRDWEEAQQHLEKIPGIVASSPYVMGPAMVEFEGNFGAAKIRGIEPESEQKIADIEKYVKKGKFDLEGDKCLVGIELANILHVQVGDKIILHGPNNLQGVMEELKKAEAKDPNAKSISEIRSLIQPLELEVTGLFETGRYQYDAEFIILPLHLAQVLYGFEGEIHGLTVRTEDPEWAHANKTPIMKEMGEPFTASSWIDQNAYLFDAIAVERGTMSVILFLIVLVSAFAIMNTLITVTVLKRKEIGILKALGSPRWQITRIFVYQGAVVGAIGIVVGLITAFFTLAFRNEFRAFLSKVMGIQILPKSVYQLSELPAEIVPSHIVLICVASFVCCLLAGLLPAMFAAKLDPVKALREE